MRVLARTVFVASCLLFIPAAAYAQASITGTVRDTSGAVLPGVTIEAASPVLIEKTRSVISDGSGQFRIVDLRPGLYTVTFSLAGFNTVKREGVELTGTFTAAINAEMKVGSLQETITVTGATPTVDLQSTTKQRVMNHEIIDAVPTGRLYANLGVLVPGVASNQADVGGSTGDNMPSLTAHGSKAVDMRVLQNGVTTATLQAGGNIGMATPNVQAMQEVAIDSGSVSAELATGGPRVNFIPRDGGNTFKSSTFISYASSGLQANNLTQDLIDRGLKVADAVKVNYDINPGFGGPIAKDKVWFWYTGRWNKADNYVGGMYYNLNANNPASFTYAPDTSKQAFTDIWQTDNQIRMTYQYSPRNKFAATWDQQTRCNCPFYVSANRSPEAANDRRSPTQRLLHGEWSSPITSKVLLEGVILHRTERWGNMPPYLEPEGFLSGSAPGIIGVNEQGGSIPGLWYRSGGTGNGIYNNTWVPNYFWRAAASYITGKQAIKVGINDAFGNLNQTQYNYAPITYRFNNGVPNQITEWATPYTILNDEVHDLGIFAQDRFTLSRTTITLGVRYDWFKSQFPEQTLGPALLDPTRNLAFAPRDNLNWKDITPRMGLVHDLMGDGKTALRISLNKYLQGQGLNGLGNTPNPVTLLALNTTRNWTDANNNKVVDCNLTNGAQQDLRAGCGDFCGAYNNANFLTPNQANNSFDPDLLTGWNHRNFNWEFAAGAQHEILPRVSVDFAYYRRWFGNFQVTDNTLVSASDFTPYSYTTPLDPRLPGGGGSTVTGFYDLNPNKIGLVQNNNTLSDKFGKWTEHWNGIDIGINARLPIGLTLQGGIGTGHQSIDACEVLQALPEMLTGLSNGPFAVAGTGATVADSLTYCKVQEPMLTQGKVVAIYRIPKIDVQIASTFQSIPGPVMLANRVTVPGETTLGRAFTGAANATISLVTPNSLYGERRNQLDFRFGKNFRAGGKRAAINVDLYNALNTNAVLTLNNNYGAAWQTPQSILTARYVRFGAQFDF
jgi:hypothetical protein